MKRIIQFKYRVLVLLIEILTILLLLLLAYNFVSMPTKKTTFYLEESNTTSILKTLNKLGYKTYPIDKYVLGLMHGLMPGWYSLEGEKEGRFSFFKNLHLKKVDTMQVKLYAGETSIELTKRLANDMKLDPIKLLNIYKEKSLFSEADIFEGRYIIARNADENTTMNYLFETSNKIFEQFSKYNCKKTLSTLDLKILLIIASIIQKESNLAKEMPLISSVIYNRLEKNMKLQMDGTLNYGKYAHTIVTPERIKTDESYFNTYKYKGLPPAPLSTISVEALKAAYYPAKSDYLFFMLNKDGSHNFAATYKEHLANIRSFKAKKKRKKEKKNTSEKKKIKKPNIVKSKRENNTTITTEVKKIEINISKENILLEKKSQNSQIQ